MSWIDTIIEITKPNGDLMYAETAETAAQLIGCSKPLVEKVLQNQKYYHTAYGCTLRRIDMKDIGKMPSYVEQQRKERKCKRRQRKGRPIVQLTLDERYVKTWSSIKEAADQLCLYSSDIIKCAKGYTKTCGPYKWCYADKYANSAKNEAVKEVSNYREN